MKKYSLTFILFSLITINGFLFYKNEIKAKNILFIEKDLNTRNLLIKNLRNKITQEFKITQESENVNLNPLLKLVDIKGDSILLSNIITKRSIVLKYSVLNCGECVDSEFKVLEKNNLNFSDEIIILTHYDRIRGLITAYRKLEKMGLTKKIKLFMIPDNELGVPLDKYNTPYYFTIDENYQLNNIFIPDKDNSELSEFYLKSSIRNFKN